MADEDSELSAMVSIVGILAALDDGPRSRVLRYAMERFGLPEPTRGTTVVRDAAATSETSVVGSFEDFASLFDAANPVSGPLRALVAGYWFQVCLGQSEFDGQSVNTELKNLGHPSKNITSDLSSLMNQSPRLAMQLRKSGKSQQARKTYKLTIEGVRRVKSLLVGGSDGSTV